MPTTKKDLADKLLKESYGDIARTLIENSGFPKEYLVSEEDVAHNGGFANENMTVNLKGKYAADIIKNFTVNCSVLMKGYKKCISNTQSSFDCLNWMESYHRCNNLLPLYLTNNCQDKFRTLNQCFEQSGSVQFNAFPRESFALRHCVDQAIKSDGLKIIVRESDDYTNIRDRVRGL